jgi:hypothetical protein
LAEIPRHSAGHLHTEGFVNLNEQAFAEWLNSSQCLELLRRCVAPQKFAHAGETDELAADLWLLLRRRGGKAQTVLGQLLTQGDWIGFERKIRSMLRSMVAETQRDPLYRRVRQVLCAAGDEFQYRPGQDYSVYGAKTGTQSIPPFEELRAGGWNPVYPDMNPEELKTSKGILILASDFKNQLAAYLGEIRAIPLRELCAYIRSGFPVHLVYSAKNPEESLSPDDDEDMDADMAADESLNPAHTHSHEFLADLAHCVAAHLERINLLLVFCLLQHCELSLENVAGALDLSGPSGVSYHKKKAFALIRELTSLHEGLSPPNLNPELFETFLHLLLEHCNHVDCSRYH